MIKQLTAIIEREGDGYVALCPEVDVASQGESVGEPRANLNEALELFLEMASAQEIQARLHDEVHESRSHAPRGNASPDALRRIRNLH